MGTERWWRGKFESAMPAAELRGGRQNIWLRTSQMATCEPLTHTDIGESEERDAAQRQKKPGNLLDKGPESKYVRLWKTDTLCHN